MDNMAVRRHSAPPARLPGRQSYITPTPVSVGHWDQCAGDMTAARAVA